MARKLAKITNSLVNTENECWAQADSSLQLIGSSCVALELSENLGLG
jgi:hypothetical protein